MRIISKKRDYYDCIQAHGQDRTNVYVREPEEVFLGRGGWPFPQCHANEGSFHIIGFCGKIYPMIQMYKAVQGHGDTQHKTINCFSIENVDAFMEGNCRKKEFDHYRGVTEKHYQGGRCFWRTRRQFIEWFQECKEKKSSYFSLFEERRCPLFVAQYGGQHGRNSTIIYNDLLRPVGFFRIFDTYSTFQEISMFMSNFAIPQKPMPVLDDITNAERHGYNKWSFRREPGGK